MNGFLYALIACFLAGLGARDQMLVATLSARLGRHGGLLVAALITAAMATGVAVWAGQTIAPTLSPEARAVLAAMALVAGGLESLVLTPGPPPRQPTRSLFAAGLVLGALQVFDATRFIALAIALATDMPASAGLGALAGNGAALTLGWLAAEDLAGRRRQAAWARRGAGALLLLAGLATALWAWTVMGQY